MLAHSHIKHCYKKLINIYKHTANQLSGPIITFYADVQQAWLVVYVQCTSTPTS